MQPATHTVLAAALAAAISSTAHAQFQINWYTIDSGGGSSSGGTFAISGTIGQPDAGASSGGTFQCTGGFWAAPIAGQCYADCDQVGGLTPNDFQCFLTAYTGNNPYADCDGVGGLTPNDFQCFLTKYIAGCS